MTSFNETDPSFDAENPSFDAPKSSNENAAMQAYQSYEEHDVDMKTNLTEKSFDEDTSHKSTDVVDTPSLRALNFANLLAYIANASIVFAVGSTNLSDYPTNAEVSAQYPSLMTPAGYAFSIWAVIFLSQLVWAIFQLLPSYRSSDMVIDGVGWNYVRICFAQIAWTVFFTMEEILLSLIAMIAILIPLVIVLLRIAKIRTEDNTTYAILKFPFEIHAAWIMAASLVNANILLIDLELSKTIQIVAAIITLTILASAGIGFTLRGQWVIPAVLGWASLAIAVRLSDPTNVAMVERFPSIAVAGIEFAAGGLAAFLWMFIVARIYILKRDDSDAEDESDNDDNYVKL
jgi:hypothetical protein